MGNEVETALRVLGRTLDAFVAIFLGRPDKYWSWAVTAVFFLAVSVGLVWLRGDPILTVFPPGWTILAYGLPLALVPVRKKWGWPRG